MLPKMPVKLTFDPAENPGTSPLWELPAGKILMLLWRPTHLCSASWFMEAMYVARAIESQRPKTADQLAECFHDSLRRFRCSIDFTASDVDEFCVEAIDYFTGRDAVSYSGEIAGVAEMTVRRNGGIGPPASNLPR